MVVNSFPHQIIVSGTFLKKSKYGSNLVWIYLKHIVQSDIEALPHIGNKCIYHFRTMQNQSNNTIQVLLKYSLIYFVSNHRFSFKIDVK